MLIKLKLKTKNKSNISNITDYIMSTQGIPLPLSCESKCMSLHYAAHATHVSSIITDKKLT